MELILQDPGILMIDDLQIKPMLEENIDSAINLVAVAMNANEADYAAKAFQFYFQCKDQNIDSARLYYCAWSNNILCGLVGLHHFRWGPPENVWLSWFAVHPDYQGKGFGSMLIDVIESMVVDLGYQKLFIETYSGIEFKKARKFYIRKGYVKTGEIHDYLPDKNSMIVYKKNLSLISE